MFDAATPITIAGAGSIGCHAGGCLALAGRRVTLLGRPWLADAVRAHGLTIVDLDGRTRRLAPGRIEATDDPAAALAAAKIILVTVKSGATAEMAGLIAAHARADAIVVSLQNGTDNARLLREQAGGRRVLAGMVPFNVVQKVEPAPVFHRTTSGDCLVEAGVPGLAGFLNVDGLPVGESGEIDRILWGKLLLNLNNALNALSGLPLATQLSDRRWRLVLAAQIAEALKVLGKAGIEPARIGALRPGLLPFVLKLPDFLFRRVARRMLSVDPEARSSMWEDLKRKRTTEVDQFQGAILRLAEAHGADAPLSRKILGLVRKAEEAGRGSPRLEAEEIGRDL